MVILATTTRRGVASAFKKAMEETCSSLTIIVRIFIIHNLEVDFFLLSESGFVLYSEGQNGIIYCIWRVTVDGDCVGCIATIPRASVSDSSYVAGN